MNIYKYMYIYKQYINTVTSDSTGKNTLNYFTKLIMRTNKFEMRLQLNSNFENWIKKNIDQRWRSILSKLKKKTKISQNNFVVFYLFFIYLMVSRSF